MTLPVTDSGINEGKQGKPWRSKGSPATDPSMNAGEVRFRDDNKDGYFDERRGVNDVETTKRATVVVTNRNCSGNGGVGLLSFSSDHSLSLSLIVALSFSPSMATATTTNGVPSFNDDGGVTTTESSFTISLFPLPSLSSISLSLTLSPSLPLVGDGGGSEVRK
ncbi:hypothetical protein PIB30_063450 [Stylosanthes scabra]|uniref:Uncharacterized protein n=1 Tax=Stylosanthes scabra TaxID=79078 RepID=A0ABU6RLI1_9FABA|nr:hypothetical protein [Stylosanthes scabra]